MINLCKKFSVSRLLKGQKSHQMNKCKRKKRNEYERKKVSENFKKSFSTFFFSFIFFKSKKMRKVDKKTDGNKLIKFFEGTNY